MFFGKLPTIFGAIVSLEPPVIVPFLAQLTTANTKSRRMYFEKYFCINSLFS
jgi:hypothetical protein